MPAEELETCFNAWRNALNQGDLDRFYSAIDEEAMVFDEDTPWRFSKTEFVDHIAFHATQWESFQWVPRDLRFQVRGDTGIVSGYATFRGKPKDCGFRQRFMGFTQTWLRGADGWKMLCLHQGPLHGQIDGASPS
jgi:ketosteroid isomerase-like protein